MYDMNNPDGTVMTVLKGEECSLILRVARAISHANGHDFDSLPHDKKEKYRRLGTGLGVLTATAAELSQPTQSDYTKMAFAALKEVNGK